MENNKNLESAFADTKNLEMTPEVEQELNKIYEEKEGIDMLNNNNEIKRGTEITNGKEATIYTLEFLKDNVKLYSLYLLDWGKVLENENSEVKEFAINKLYECGEEGKTPFLINTKLEKGICKNIINEIITKIDNTKRVIIEDKAFIWYECSVEDIKSSIEKMDALVEYFKSFTTIAPLTDKFIFYEDVIRTPIYEGHSMIKSIIEKLENVTEETFQMEF